MTDRKKEDLLARLAGVGSGDDPWSKIAVTQPQHELPGTTAAAVAAPPATPGAASTDPGAAKLDQLCQRITNLVGDQPTASAAGSPARHESGDGSFVPIEPGSFRDAQVSDTEVEALVLKFLLNRGSASGREIADQVKLAFKLIEGLLAQMKTDQLVYHRSSAPMNDYVFAITDLGRERGRRLAQQCTYFGSAPVSLGDYIKSVAAQTLQNLHPSVDDLRRAFSDLLINQRMLNRLGPAIHSGRGLFLFGSPGNGKTSIAERVTKAFGETIWIPRALGVDGDIIRIFDPANHDEVPVEASEGLLDERRIDKRWVRIRRPTIVVGGELTMDSLEVTLNTATGICEAPLQMKSNCGTLVIDDFGRQRMSVDALLNRWIVPLEKRYDFLNLPSGKKIQVPFDQLIIFSTNLEPKDLVDDAFLRRIPYKIEVLDPSEEEFRELFRIMAPKLGFVYRDEPINYLIERHYRQAGRPLRCCHPRDLLMQVRNYCYYQGHDPELTREYLDFAVDNYFAVM